MIDPEAGFIALESEHMSTIPPMEWALLKAMAMLHFEMSVSLLLVSRKASGAPSAKMVFEDYQQLAVGTQEWIDGALPSTLGLRFTCTRAN